MKKLHVLGIALLAACIGGAAHYAFEDKRTHYECPDGFFYQNEQGFHEMIRKWTLFATTVLSEEDPFARRIRTATLGKEGELLPDVFLQEAEAAPHCDSRERIIRALYAIGFESFVMQKKTGNAYVHKSLFPSLARLLLNGDIPTQALQDPAGHAAVNDLILQCGDPEIVPDYMPLKGLLYDMPEYKKLSRQYIDFLCSKHAEPGKDSRAARGEGVAKEHAPGKR